jgi:hypothetical protein
MGSFNDFGAALSPVREEEVVALRRMLKEQAEIRNTAFSIIDAMLVAYLTGDNDRMELAIEIASVFTLKVEGINEEGEDT